MKEQKRKLNVRLLRRIQKHILAEPRRLNMRDWNTTLRDPRNLPDEMPPCGTVGCIAGWATMLSGKKPRTRHGFARMGCELLGITGWSGDPTDMLRYDSQARKLFVVDYWPLKYQHRYDKADTLSGQARFQGHAKATSDRIEHFIKTSE